MCTAVTFNSNHFYFGRNFDWSYSYGEQIVVMPGNYILNCSDGTVINHHYSVVGMALQREGYPLFFDGTNEMGLSMAGLHFPGNAHYCKAKEGFVNIASYELIGRVLSTFKSASEAADFLKNVNITDDSFAPGLPPSPLHWIMADEKNCYTIEPVRDGLNISENPLGVLTNNPPFDYHMHNAANYLNLTSGEPVGSFCTFAGIAPYSNGLGAFGLPGDMSSASRFVRAVFVKNHIIPGDDVIGDISAFFKILSSSSVPKGTVQTACRENSGTIYSSCCDTHSGVYYCRVAANDRICAVDMHRENTEGTSVIAYSVPLGQDILGLN